MWLLLCIRPPSRLLHYRSSAESLPPATAHGRVQIRRLVPSDRLGIVGELEKPRPNTEGNKNREGEDCAVKGGKLTRNLLFVCNNLVEVWQYPEVKPTSVNQPYPPARLTWSYYRTLASLGLITAPLPHLVLLPHPILAAY